MKIDDVIQTSLLYDFYGSLLTDRQREVMELYYGENLSLSELAAEISISRQGVHDNVKRCNKILSDYEEKLHLVEKFVNIKEKIHRIHGLAKNCESISKEELVSEVEHISQEILEEL